MTEAMPSNEEKGKGRLKEDRDRSVGGNGGGVLLTSAQKENLCSFFNLPSNNALLQFIYVLTLKSHMITTLGASV
jgi:hypothetical protein